GSQETVVDEDTRKLSVDRPREERCDDRRIDASRESADHAVAPYACTQKAHLLLDERAHLPVAAASADHTHEISQDLCAILRMRHFGVKLQAENRSRMVPDCCRRTVACARQSGPVCRKILHLVAVTHPHRQLAGNAAEQFRVFEYLTACPSKFA